MKGRPANPEGSCLPRMVIMAMGSQCQCGTLHNHAFAAGISMLVPFTDNDLVALMISPNRLKLPGRLVRSLSAT